MGEFSALAICAVAALGMVGFGYKIYISREVGKFSVLGWLGWLMCLGAVIWFSPQVLFN